MHLRFNLRFKILDFTIRQPTYCFIMTYGLKTLIEEKRTFLPKNEIVVPNNILKNTIFRKEKEIDLKKL